MTHNHPLIKTLDLFLCIVCIVGVIAWFVVITVIYGIGWLFGGIKKPQFNEAFSKN